MAATTYRSDYTAAQVSILNEQKTATPTLLRAVYSSKPSSFGELPLAYVSSRNETITHDAGTRTRYINGEVTIVDSYRDNIQTADLLDDLVDLLVDRYDTNTQRVGEGILELVSVTDVDVELVSSERTVVYRGVVLSFGNNKTFKVEGRQ